jgi:ABC-type sugar transport system substrate-binding protein
MSPWAESHPVQRLLSRRQFLRLTAGAALVSLLPGCHRAVSTLTDLTEHTGWLDTQRYKKNGPWRLGRSGRGDVTSWMVMFSAHIEYGVQEKFKPFFASYTTLSANWDPNKQIEDIKALLQQEIDLLLIDPLNHAVVKAGVEQAMRARVPVILASTRVPGDAYVSWVTTNEAQRGAVCADWLCHTVPSGRIVVLDSLPAAGDSQLWLDGVLHRLNLASTTHSYVVVDSPWSTSEARRLMEIQLHQSGPVDGVIVHNGVLGQGIVQAFDALGKQTPPIAGVDDWNGWLRTAREQPVRFLGLSGGANLGLRCVELATQILAGQSVPGYVEFPYEVFDETSIERLYRPDLSEHYWAIHDLPPVWIERMFQL